MKKVLMWMSALLLLVSYIGCSKPEEGDPDPIPEVGLEAPEVGSDED